MNKYTLDMMSEYRMAKRGFFPFWKDLLDAIDKVKKIDTILEFGVGSGFKQTGWSLIYPDAQVVGIERFDPVNDSPETELFCGYPTPQECIEAYNLANHVYTISQSLIQEFNIKNLKLYHGYDGYDPKTVDMVITNHGKFDIVIDDAHTRWEYTQHSWKLWKRALKYDGIYVSETPDGNGTEQWRAISEQEHISNMKWLANYYGLVVFNFKKFAVQDDPEWTSNYLAVGRLDRQMYRDVLLKYQDCIVAGENNI